MYTTIVNSNYGTATTTYANYVAISNPNYLTYNSSSNTTYSGSVDCYKYNKGADTHNLINTITRPIVNLSVLAQETGSNILVRSPIHTELNNLSTTSSIFSLYNSITNQYYSVSVSGSLGNESLKLTNTGSNDVSTVQLYNSDTNSYYSLLVNGNLGNETASISYIGTSNTSNDIDSPIFYNSYDGLYYTLTVQGSIGSERLQFNSWNGTLALELDNGSSYDLENSFGRSLDLYNTNLIVGCPNYHQFTGFSNFNVITSGSKVYVFDIDISSGTSSYYNLLTTLENIFTPIDNSFGTAVSINENWVAVGSPLENNGSGSVHMYLYENNTWNYYQTIYSPTSGSNFGYSIKLNKDTNTPSGRLMVGCGNLYAHKAYYYEFFNNYWQLIYTFAPDYSSYPLTIGDYLPYNNIRNSGSGFGNSVSIYGNTVVIGEYLDRTVYQFSGSAVYNQGSVSIYGNCNAISSSFNLIYKTYGNKNIIQNNNLGYSVDIYGNNVIAGCPKFNQLGLSSTYIQNTIFQVGECSNSSDTSLNGQVVLIQQDSSSNWDILNVFQRKKDYLSPYRAVGNNVSCGDFSFVVGAPILMTDTNRNIDIAITQSSNGAVLDDISGKSYIYNFHNLRENFHVGNVFYRNGKIVMMTSASIFSDLFGTNYPTYDITLDSQTTIYEKQIICSINPGEFNVSTNPTALDNTIYTFDLNGNGIFDFEDIDVLLRYMKYKNNQAHGLSYSTDWSSSILTADDEISLYNYYISSHEWNNTDVSQALLTYIPKWDFSNTSIQAGLDINGDGLIDKLDMNILWKYFSNRLTQANYNTYTTTNSTRKSLALAIDYLNGLSGKVKPKYIKSDFLNYPQNVAQDPTGSYLSTYCSSIGIFNDTLEMVAVAKLGTPIKVGGNNIPLNILVRMDF